jgi:antitoxin MazE
VLAVPIESHTLPLNRRNILDFLIVIVFFCNYNVIILVKTELVRIGNSRGIRIPKPLIEQCGLGDEVELRVENQSIIISPERSPRAGWEEKFHAAGTSEADEPLLNSVSPNEFDRKEWRW